MKKLIIYFGFILITLIVSTQAHAEICYTSGLNPVAYNELDEDQGNYVDSIEWSEEENPLLLRAGLTCEERDSYALGLDTIAIALEAGGIYAGCTGVGAPVAAYLGVAGIVTHVVQMAVSRLGCEDEAEKEQMKKVFLELYCQDMQSEGILCNPSRVEMREM